MNTRANRAICEYVKSALEYLKSDNKLDTIIKFKRLRDMFIEEEGILPRFKSGHFSKEFEDFTNYEEFIERYRSEICGLPEAKTAVQVLLEEGILKKRPVFDQAGNRIENPSFEQEYSSQSSNIISFLVNYIEEHQSFDFEKKKVTELYGIFERCWAEKTVNMVAIVPLIGFYSDEDTINLPDGITIERYTAEEKNAFEESLSIKSYHHDQRDYGYTNYKIAIRFTSTSDNVYNLPNELFNLIYDKIEYCITALRLLHPGRLGAYVIVMKTLDLNPVFPEYTIYSYLDFKLPQRGLVLNLTTEYYLKKEEIDELISVYLKINGYNTDKKLKVLGSALRRFNQSYSRQSYEDKIVDITVILEQTLLFGIEGELKQRLSQYGAAILGRKRDPVLTYNTLKVLYDIRSKIVHENKSLYELIMDEKSDIGKGVRKVVQKPDYEFYPLVFQITKEVLLVYLSLINMGYSMDAINQSITAGILDNFRDFEVVPRSRVASYLGIDYYNY